MKGDKVRMKKTYRPCAKLEAFYGGGPVTLNPAGSLVACAYEDETKVRWRGDDETELSAAAQFVAFVCTSSKRIH